MEEKNYIIEKIKKSNEKNLYIFFNLTKGIGIRRMRTKKEESNIRIGDKVIIDGENYILVQVFDYKNGELKIIKNGIGE